MSIDRDIIMRETDRQRIQQEHKTKRIEAVCIATPIIVAITLGASLIWKSIDTPDPLDIQDGTVINCVVQKS